MRITELSLAIALALGAQAHAGAQSVQAAPGNDESSSDESPSDSADGKRGRDATVLEGVDVHGIRQDYKADQVTSPKYTTPLRDTAQTIAIIPSQIYTDQAQTSLRDVLRNTPGITAQAGEGGNATGDNIFVRGFGARNDVYIDGVRDPGVVARDVFNIEQVEIAKGPASAVYGRGSTGGSINLVSKMARADSFASGQITLGTDDYKRTTVDANHTFGVDSALRLNAVWTDAGVAGRDEVNNKNWGFAPSLAIGLGSPTTLFVNLSHYQQDNLPDYGLPVTLPANIPVGFTIRDLDWSNFYGLVDRDYEKVKSDLGTVIVEHAFNDHAKLRNLTRYGRNDRDSTVTPPRAASATATGGLNDPGFDPGVAQIRRTDTKYVDRNDTILANQTNLSFDFTTGAIQHGLVTGAELSREKSNNYTRADRCVTTTGAPAALDVCPGGRPPVTSLYDPNPQDHYLAELYRTGAFTHAIADSSAAYLFDTLKFNEHWELTAGARWERFDVDVDSVAPATAPATGLVINPRFSRSDDMLSWRAGLVYKPAESGSIYFGYGTSFNPSADGAQGLALSNLANNVNNFNLPPEESRSVELGTKWELANDRLLFTAAIFRSEKTNARTIATIVDASGANQSVTVLGGDQEVKGVELGLSGNITERWAIFGGYAYMDSEIKESTNPLEVDRELQYVPKNSFNLWSTYRVFDRFSVGAGAQYTSGYFFANIAPTATTAILSDMTSYWLYNAMASYTINDNFGVQLNVNNIADKRYVERGYTGHFTPGAARAYLLSATWRF